MQAHPRKPRPKVGRADQSLQAAAGTPAKTRKTARIRLAERRLQLRKEAQAYVSPDEIVCQLCGKAYRAITYTHLRLRHELTEETAVADYKRRFGLRVAVSAQVNALQRSTRVAYHQRRGTHWTRQRIKTELRRLARQGTPLQASRLPQPLYDGIRRIIGSWEVALRCAGLDPNRHRANPRLDDATVLSRIHRLARQGPTPERLLRRRHPALHYAAVRRFGTWGRALRAAGLDPQAHSGRRKLTLEDVRAWIRARHRRGLSIRNSDVKSGMKRRVRLETGKTWAAYVASLGIRYPGGLKRMDWSDHAVLAAIRGRVRQGLPLNRAAVGARSQALSHQATLRFGSWDAALRAAGFDPARVRVNHSKWSQAEVIAALRKRHREGLSMCHADMRADEPRLLKAAKALFPFSLARALEAAGLDPALVRGRGQDR